jgi:hypothetical protein
VDVNHTFCSKCGKKISRDSETQPRAQQGEQSENAKPRINPASFEKFKAEKEKERASHFRPGLVELLIGY